MARGCTQPGPLKFCGPRPSAPPSFGGNFQEYHSIVMANEEPGPSRSQIRRGRSRSPDQEERSRPRDRRSPIRGERDERRGGSRRSRSRDRRASLRHDSRDREKNSRGREAGCDERHERDRHSRRHDSASRSPPRRRRRSESSSSSSSSSLLASSEPERSKDRKRSKKSKHRRDSSSSDDRREVHKHSGRSKEKRAHKSRHRSPGDDSSDEYARRKQARAEKKERKRKKREKQKKQKKEQSSKHKSAISEYGKYGIITEADMFTKDQEFRAWMVEERMLNPETVSQNKMKELFKIYMEDFNTATLPHEKYYALEKYETRMNAIRSGEVTTQSDTYDPRADEAALAAQHKRVAKTDGEVYIGRAQLEQLRRIERERVEASRMKRMGMEVKESMGVRYEAD
ncbi:uncharacterized protein VP01_1324g4 [Puccinia sorghi]|uniref:Uncharacterized protein n=1 Tax=Puccinia sorghi TaxID=27349 RepID=A0A0L6VMT2_9BASI|nr:uncharacterized protein VP01_1324g4 [Puccinia sorghi]